MDIAVAGTPFVVKLLSDASRTANMVMSVLLALAAAAFLEFSFRTQVYINQRYFQAQKGTWEIWNRSLVTALSPAEIKDFSDTPIAESIADYEKVKVSVRKFYNALIAILLLFALGDALWSLWTVHEASPQAASHDASVAGASPARSDGPPQPPHQ